MELAKRFFCLGLFLLLFQISFAQIQSVSVSAKTATQYSKNDTIYAFEAGISPSSLEFIATAPGNVNSTFEWSRFDTISKVFVAPGLTETGKITSSYTLPGPGGYKVHIFSGSGLDTTFVFWAFIDSVHTEIEKNNDGTVYRFNYTCDYVDLLLTTTWNKLRYFNPLTGLGYTFPNKIIKYEWSAEPEPEYLPKPKPNGSLRINVHPYEDTKYTVIITDSLGATATDMAQFIAIKPKADFEPGMSNEENSAPLKVKFTNNSINAIRYTWYTDLPYPDYDTLYIKDPDSLKYLEPKTYNVTLVVKSIWGCVDSMSKPIVVEPPKLSVQKAFSPDGDGSNEYFKINDVKSVSPFRIIIFSRLGKKVFETTGETLIDWQGWNGKINGDGQDASPGVYYFILEIQTFEKRPTIPWVYKDFFYLFRANE